MSNAYAGNASGSGGGNAGGVATNISSGPQVDPVQMNTFRSFVTMLGDPTAKDETKLKAAQELSEHFEVITQCSGYQSFLEHSMKIFIRILQDGDPHFISEYNIQQVKLCLGKIQSLALDCMELSK